MQTLYISQKAWKQIDTAMRRNPEVETGGILMGYPLNKQDWIVTYASEPGPKAVHLPKSINFDDQYLKKLVRNLRTRGLGKWRYIGDWHSHTVRRLSPSRGDKVTLWQKTSQSVYHSQSPIMLITGLDRRNQVSARAFTLADDLREIRRIELVDRRALRQLLQIQRLPDANG